MQTKGEKIGAYLTSLMKLTLVLAEVIGQFRWRWFLEALAFLSFFASF